MKKILLVILLTLMYFKVNASIVVMDADSGRVIYSKNKDEIKLIASTSKIMTTIIALENSNIKKEVTIGDEIKEVNGSMLYIKQDEKYTIEDLIYGLMLRSGNDAAMSIATNVLGYKKFIEEMNKKALHLQMYNTTFENPHGLNDDTENYSTAHDLSKLMRYALKNETFRKIIKSKKYNNWYNKNELLTTYKYLLGGKIGYTKRSGQVYVSAATKNNKTLIISTINESNKYELHKQLYEKYFDEVQKYRILNKYTFTFKTEDNVHYYINNDFDVLLRPDEKENIKIKLDLSNSAVKIYLKDELIHSEKLYKVEYNTKKNKIKELLSFLR